jgi:cytochrome c biogenesis protein
VASKPRSSDPLRPDDYIDSAVPTSSTTDEVTQPRLGVLGYLRETGNLVFHAALVGMLITVAIGGSFGYTGQRVIVQGEPFTNVLSAYDSITKGRFFTESALVPYSLRLDDFVGHYELDASTGQWHPTDFVASVSTRESGGEWTPGTIKVNSPLTIGGTDVYLLGNGYAPVITVRDPDGTAVFSGAVPFLPLDGNLRSRGVVKVPDGLDRQLGLQGFFYPDPVLLEDGTYTSFSPTDHGESLVTLFVYAGDLGLDEGGPVNAYALDTDGMTQLAGGDSGVAALQLAEGQTVDLPDGLGTIEYEGLRRFVSLDIHHDPTPGWALLFAVLILGGLLVSLFVPRRRMWVKVVGTRIEYAGLARGEDPTLEAAVADLARRHQAALGDRMDA